MIGKSSPDMNDWAAFWGDAQRKYWQSWLDLSRQAAGDAAGKREEPAVNPWAQSFDLWSKLVTGALPSESRDWASKLADMNRGYLQMGEILWKMLSAAQGASPHPESGWDAVGHALRQMQEGFASGLGAGKDPWAGFATLWGMPLDTWRRVHSACSAMPGDMGKALRGFGAPGEPPESALSRLLSTPSLGYTREWQEEVRQWQQLWLEHGEAVREYGRVLAGITDKAAEALGEKLRELAAKGKAPETLRTFYDLWVDSGEEAYAEAAAKADFTHAQARLVNTLMALKRQEQKMVDEVLSALNMPTRRELDTSHRRVHQLQRQLWRLQEVLDESDVRALREEVAALRREVEALRAREAPPAPEKRPAARRARPAGKT
jgi:class III poly(R)-hydroxyalkanoic acid synthase PhaE subunit